jgi:3-oxoacyl-[acyl-carrier-protein] synthase-1
MDSFPVIAGLGGQTSLGLTWPATAAAVRAGLNCSSLSEYLRGLTDGEPLKVSRLVTLPVGASPYERMKLMGVAAAGEALAPWVESFAGVGASPPDLPVLISVPPERPGFPPGAGKKLAQEIMQSLPIPVDRPRCRLASTGHEGGLAGLGCAADAVRDGAAAFLVGGVDSYLEIGLLHWLEGQDRLKREGQPNGFVPGEGAGFVLVCSSETARQRKLPVFAEVLGGGRGVEPRCWWGREPTTGEGLTEALQAVFQGPGFPPGQVKVTYSDLNGESWRSEEWSYAYVRTGKRHASPLDHRHPASCWGDVGAATGTLLAGMAALDLARYPGDQGTALVWAASDLQPFRSACLLRRPQE